MSEAETGGKSLFRSVLAGISAARDRFSVEKIGPLEDFDVRLPKSGIEYQITRPSDVDALLDMAEHDPEENLPYWSAIWPSGIALADEILAEPGLVRGRRVLELGSGLGVTAIAALQAGAQLIISDYSDESLALAHYNIEVNGLNPPPAVQMNWRKPSDRFTALVGAGFPIVLAADVLYEARDVEPLLDLIDWIVAPGGLLLLAEPRRPTASKFIEQAAERGWAGNVRNYDGPWTESNDTGVVVRVHLLTRSHPER